MSVIVAVSDGTRVCMACDSQATVYGKKIMLAKPKIFAKDGVLVAGAGSGQLLREWCESELRPRMGWPELPGDGGLEWVARYVADEFRRWLKERDLLRRTTAEMLEMPCDFIVAKGADFVVVDSSGALVHVAEKWHAIGSGAPEARGALHAMRGWDDGDLESELKARTAVEAACALDDGCSGPVHVLWTEG